MNASRWRPMQRSPQRRTRRPDLRRTVRRAARIDGELWTSAAGAQVLVGSGHRSGLSGRRRLDALRASGDLLGDQAAELREPVRAELLAQDRVIVQGSLLSGRCTVTPLVGALLPPR